MDDEDDFMMVNVNGVFIVSLNMEYDVKVKRSVEEKFLWVEFIVFVNLNDKNEFFLVFLGIILCGMNNMCVVDGVIDDFDYKLCKLIVDKIDNLGILFCVVKEFKDVFFKD